MYNVENYISRCLNSIFTQNYSLEKYEVILINDGSPDNSEKKARIICEKYKNAKIISQKNKGLGGARNTGIKNAKGEYLLFLDSDDYLLNNSLEILEKNLDNQDIIEFSVSIVNKEKEIKSILFENKKFNKGYKYILNSKSINSACNKLYKLSFLKQYELQFKERIYGEDIEFNNRAFFFSENTVSISPQIIAFYQSENSITRSKNINNRMKYMKDIKYIISSYFQFTLSFNDLNLEQKKYLNYRLCSMNVNSILYLFKNRFSKIDIKNYINYLKKNHLFNLETPLRKRNLHRRILKVPMFLNLLIFLNCKS